MRKRRLILAGLSLAATLMVISLAGSQSRKMWKDPVDQWANIKFSHKLHVDENEIDCTACHTSVDTSKVSSDFLLPTMDACNECHEVEDEEQCAMCHPDEDNIVTYDIPVREITFAHKNHLERGVECLTCHTGIDQGERPSTAFLPAMTTCMQCHSGEQASKACETCHVKTTTLMPATHRQVDWLKEHKRVVKVGSLADDCASCHEDNFCQTCHAGVSVQFTRGALTRPVAENRPLKADTKALVRQRVHQFNYRFFHAIDLRTKRADCTSCHDQQQFCNACHTTNQDAGFGRPRPLSHEGTGFVRIGVGGGGGRHATLARRDIESCAACHDVEGRDPACVRCHFDRTPGKGNDPRTHAANFMRDEDGEWHSSPGAACFNCHLNTQKPGIGFCGYCHGAK